MPTINPTLPTDNTTADVADYNNPINTIVDLLNGNLDSDNFAANAVIASKIADSAVIPSKLLTGAPTSWDWQTWAPSYTNLTVGGATVTAKYTQVGELVVLRYLLVATDGTSSIGAGPTISLPVTAHADYNNRFVNIGTAATWDNSTGTDIFGGWAFTNNSATVMTIRWLDGSATLSSTSQFAEAASDTFSITAAYQIA